MHIKKGDNVIMLAGANKGKKGKVLRVFPTLNKVIVEGVNLKKKARKARKQGEASQMIEMAMPVDASNVAKAK